MGTLQHAMGVKREDLKLFIQMHWDPVENMEEFHQRNPQLFTYVSLSQQHMIEDRRRGRKVGLMEENIPENTLKS